jgi:hypothetical protein
VACVLLPASVASAAPTISAQTNENSTTTAVFTGGDTSNVTGSADSGVYYRFLLKNPSGTVAYSSTCPLSATVGTTSVSAAYTFLSSDPVGTTTSWNWTLVQYGSASDCAANTNPTSTSSTTAAYHAEPSSFSDVSASTSRTVFAPGSTQYVEVAGLPATWTSNVNTTWTAGTTGSTSCLNSAGNDRPGTDTNGVVPSQSNGDKTLAYPPGGNTFSLWNRLTNYDTNTTAACPATSSSTLGQWKLTVSNAGVNPVTVNAFYVSTTPVSSATAPSTSTSTSLSIPYTATYANGSGISLVELWVKRPGDSSYSPATSVSNPSGSCTGGAGNDVCGTFSYTAAAGDGSYSFYTRAKDNVSTPNYEAAKSSADSTTVVDTGPPSSAASISSAYATSTPITVNYTASDSGSGVQDVELWVKKPGDSSYSLAQTTTSSAGSGSFSYSPSPSTSGLYSFYTRAHDNNTNYESAPASADATTTLDLSQPTSQASAPGSSKSTTWSVPYTASDPGGTGLTDLELWVKGPGDSSYSLVSTVASPSTSGTVSYDSGSKGEGTYNFYTRVHTVSGVYEAVPGSPPDSTTVLDTTAPSTTDNVPSSVQSSLVSVTLTGSDSGSGVATTYYTTDDSDPTDSSNSDRHTYNAASKPTLDDGDVIKYASVDNAGNVESVKTSSLAAVDQGSTFDAGNGVEDPASSTSCGTLANVACTSDWKSLNSAGSVTLTADDNTHDTGFVGGNKEQQPGSWAFNTSSGGVTPAKSNVLAAWSALEPTRSTSWLYLAFKRSGTTGNSFIAFELNQSSATWVNTVGTTIPCRTDGDLLVSFSTGNPVQLELYRWVGTPGSGGIGCPNGGSGTFVDSGPLSAPNASGAMNFSSAITNYLQPGSYGSTFSTMAFGEAKINLPAVLSSLGASPCTSFVSMQVQSRSSSSISSALIDYGGPQPVSVQSCAVSGQKFEDSNANGTKDSGESGLSGWTFYLDSNNNGVQDSGEPSAVTGSDGNYHILNVPAGTYTVRESPTTAQASAGWVRSKPALSNGRTVTVGSAGGSSSRNDFGNYRPATYSGSVFQDTNRSAVRDGAEPGLSGWVVYVDYDNDGVKDVGEPAASTDSSGNYTLTGVKPGTGYALREVSQGSQWSCTAPSGCAYTSLSPTSGQTITGKTFGNAPTFSVSGTKFNDLNGNGVKDSGEPGLSGWTVYADLNGNSTLDSGEPSTTTASDGTYTITPVNSGTMKIREVAQSGWTSTLPSLGYYPLSFAVTGGVPDANATGKDFGAYQAASVAGRIYNDANSDNSYDSGEGLSGWTAYVDYNGNAVKDSGEPSATTASDGTYTISAVKPGTGYQVGEVNQAGYQCTSPTNCVYTSVSPTSGEAITGKDFRHATTQTVQGTVYQDSNHNGAKDSSEPGVSGWVVYVDSNNNGAKDSGEPNATSAADGTYTITGVAAATTINLRTVAQDNWTCDGPNSNCLYGTATSNSFTVAANSGATGEDFGVFQVNTVTGSVFGDDNANAAKDGSEAGQSGWVAYVDSNDNGTKDSGEPSATTDSSGNFSITSVTPQSNGKVRLVSQNGWTISKPSTSDSGFSDPNYSLFTLASSSTASGNDFGVWQAASVSGVKWEDRDRDGVFDSDEFGLSGVTVYADANGNSTLDAGEQSASTDSFGAYTISGLRPGNYTIREVVSASSYTCTSPGTCSYDITPTSGQSLTDRNFGNAPNNTFSGQQFHDRNANGAEDSGDGGLSGWVIYVDYNDNGSRDSDEPSATTDASGNYTLSNVDPGTYTVREESQSGWTCSAPSDCSYSQTFAAGTTESGKDFGTWQSASVAGKVFEDSNRNGGFDTGEPGQSSRHVYVDTNDNGLYDSGEPDATTASDGTYTISGITPGTVTVREELTGLNVCTTPSPCYHSVTLSSQDAVTGKDFGNNDPGATIEGAVYDDQNNNGARTADSDGDGVPDEPGIAGVTVFADYNNNGTLDSGEPSATTGTYGDYTLTNVNAGTWTVREVLPGGYVCSTGSGCTSSQTVVSGAYTGSVDFGNFQSYATGTVYEDVNANGTQDSGESGLSGWAVYVDSNDNGSEDSGEPSATTAADGTYTLYDVPAGSPKIRQVTPSGYTCSAPASCVNTPAVTAGTPVSGQDFGDWTPASVAGRVYSDEDYSSTFSGGDTGLSGVRVFADLNDNGSWDSGEPSATAASDGTYTITGITPATGVKIRASAVSGYSCSSPSDCLYTQTLISHQSQTGDDFSEQASRTVSGTQYDDLNANGTKDSGEPVLSGWVVYVDLNNNGSKDAGEPNATTAADGTYTITNVPGGTYNLREVAQAGYTCSAPSGCAHSLTWSAGTAFTGKDFGVYRTGSIAGTVYTDGNADGVHGGSETSGVSGVTVYLDANDNDVFDSGETSTTTSGSGAYSFSGLMPGSYTVRQVLPSSSWHCSEPSSTFASCEHAVTVTSGSSTTGKDFGDWQDVAFTGTVYDDLNANGSQGTGELGVSGRTVTLDPGTPANLLDDVTTTTDPGGAYSFSNLVPGVAYTVSTTLPSGSLCSQPGGSCSYTATPSSGDGTATKDFGTYARGSIAGTVYNDGNADGTHQGSESAGLSGVTVYLDANGNDALDAGETSTTTSASGAYSFSGLTPGSYTVRQVLPSSSWHCSDPSSTFSSCKYAVAVTSGSSTTGRDFGDWQDVAIGGTVYGDSNANGAQGSGESGISGRTVKLDPGTPSDASDDVTTTTGAGGAYSLTGLRPGVAYTVSTAVPNGWSCSQPGSSCGYTLTPASGDGTGTRDFGTYQGAQVSGRQYEDLNGNGAHDGGEPYLNGWRIYLDVNDNGSFDAGTDPSAVTATAGGQEGAYTISISRPEGTSHSLRQEPAGSGTSWRCTQPTGATTTTDCWKALTLSSGSSETADFGDYRPSTVKLVERTSPSGGGQHFGFHSSEVSGLDSASLGNGESRGPVTVTPGTYHVTQAAVSGWDLTAIDCGSEGDSSGDLANRTATFAATSGDVITCTFTDRQRGSISGHAFEDRNGDGTQDAGDPPLSGRTAYVDLNGNGTLDPGEPTATSDATGDYTFAGMTPGTYTVRVVLAGQGWHCSTPRSSCSASMTVDAGGSATATYGGWQEASISGTKYRDANGNGTRDPGEDGVAGTVLYVDSNDNGRLDDGEPSATSNADGGYSIGGLPPGSYVVRASADGTFTCTDPSPCERRVTLASGGQASGQDFGDHRHAAAAVIGPPTLTPTIPPRPGDPPITHRTDPNTGEDIVELTNTGSCQPLRIDTQISGDTSQLSDVHVVFKPDNPSHGEQSIPLSDTPPEPPDGTWSGVLPCAENGGLTLVYTQDGVQHRVSAGRVELIDPQGTIYDRQAYESAVANGTPPDQARCESALSGATVTLQRQTDSGFVDIPADDPGMEPHVNPQITRDDGVFRWDVSPGTYRVVVNAPGYDQGVSTAAQVPPPITDMNVGLTRQAGTPAPPKRDCGPTPTLKTVTPRTCLHRAVTVFVTGRGIRRVVWYLDGKPVGTSRRATRANRWSVNLPRSLTSGRHRVQAKVYFSGGRSKIATLKLPPAPPCRADNQPQAISGIPAHCAAVRFTAFVRDRQIRHVTYFVDGHEVESLGHADFARRYTVTLDPAQLGAGTHELRAVVSFARGAHRPARTLTARFHACHQP